MKILATSFSVSVLGFLAATLLVPGGASAGQPSLLTYRAQVHVTGQLTQTHQVDKLGNCTPGIKYTVTEKAKVNVTGKLLIETYKNQLIRSSNVNEPGGATHSGSLGNVEESNYCPPEEPVEIEKPECLTRDGRALVGFQMDGRNKAPWRVSLGITRRGKSQSLDCMWSYPRSGTPRGSYVTTLDSSFSGMVLPLDLRVQSFHTLGRQKRLIRTIRIGGGCRNPIVYRGTKVPGAGDEFDDCEVEGAFRVTVKRLSKALKNRGVSVASVRRAEPRRSAPGAFSSRRALKPQ